MIKQYINYRKTLFIFYISMAIILLLVNCLYNYPLKAIEYSLFISGFIFLIFLGVDYVKFNEKMKYLEDINTNITTDKHQLPDTTDSMELEYQKIIFSLYNIIGNSMEAMDHAHSEQVEYYTMWVHQIKTPISAMQLAFQTYASTEDSKLLEQELFKIEQYVELALQYTKMSSLSSDLVIREYSLDEIVNQSIKKYAQLFIFKKLSVQIEEFHEKVVTDSKWLSFILEQILSNAIKYTNQGGIKISYDKHTLRIADTGMGIRKEDIERIYEKGYTGYNGRLDKKASGIGLYLTKKVADSLAIRISISSEVGQGTIVELKFPEDKAMLKREYD